MRYPLRTDRITVLKPNEACRRVLTRRQTSNSFGKFLRIVSVRPKYGQLLVTRESFSGKQLTPQSVTERVRRQTRVGWGEPIFGELHLVPLP